MLSSGGWHLWGRTTAWVTDLNVNYSKCCTIHSPNIKQYCHRSVQKTYQ